MPALTEEWIKEQLAVCENATPAHQGYPLVLMELQGLWASFDVYSRAVRAAEQLYAEAHPDIGELTLPDTGTMVAWLVGEIERLRGEAADGSTE